MAWPASCGAASPDGPGWSQKLKLLALDLGDRRIGLAVGHAPDGTAFPAGYLTRSKLSHDLEAVLNAARERGVEGYVVGVPYALDGTIGRQAGLAQGFIRELRKKTSMPVYEVDESFTSIEAEAILREAGCQPSRKKGATDETAAALILERFLDQFPAQSKQ